MSVTLVPSSARTTTGTSGALDKAITGRGRATAAIFWLSITADESTGSDVLEVFLQHSLDGGSTWQDFAAFDPAAGNAGNAGLVQQLQWVRNTNDTEAQGAQMGAQSAGTVDNGPIGPDIRVYWAITDASGSASFTFEVSGRFELDR